MACIFLRYFLLCAVAFPSGYLCKEVTLLDSTKLTNLAWTVQKPNEDDLNTGWLEESYAHHENGKLKRWRSYTVCDYDSDSVSNWLITPPIPTAQAERVYIELKFSMRDCSSLPGEIRSCKETFTLYATDTSSPSLNLLNLHQLQPIDRVAADDGRFSYRNEGLINTETRSWKVGVNDGVRFAFHDEGACMSLLAVRIYYVACASVSREHAIFPEVAAGPLQASIKRVTGRCVDLAKPSGEVPSYLCKSDGSWDLHSGACQCQDGYQAQGQACHPVSGNMNNHE